MATKSFEVSESDWDLEWVYNGSSKIQERVLGEQAPGLHFWWITKLYKRYRLGDWNNVLPAAETIPDNTVLMDDAYYNYCLFHRNHPKFGKNILECGHSYSRNNFVFFDYSILEPVFQALNAEEDLPYVPIYHAHPNDRREYLSGTPLWE